MRPRHERIVALLTLDATARAVSADCRRHIGVLLREEREALGLSLRQAGRLVGLSPVGVMDTEKARHVKPETVERMLRAYRGAR